jgi:hypothetical protein
LSRIHELIGGEERDGPTNKLMGSIVCSITDTHMPEWMDDSCCPVHVPEIVHSGCFNYYYYLFFASETPQSGAAAVSVEM